MKCLANRMTKTERPLYEDIRLLGQILGDTVREQEGETVFARIETIRRLSVAGQRKADPAAGRELDALLASLTPSETVSVIRAFAYFSHLANIAEDRHFLRRRAGSAQAPGTLAHAFERLAADGVTAEDVSEALAHSYLSPVLTAHPTEVQRRSTLDAERAVADLLSAREGCHTEAELRDNEELLHARIVQLWQTRILRTARLTVHDEIDNALLYYRATFIREIPKLYAELEQRLGRPVPTFLRMGNWIGGDRDGNPNVDATTLDLTVRLHSRNHPAPLSDRNPSSRRGPFDVGKSGDLFAGTGGAGRRLRRRQSSPRRRILPPRPDRGLRASGRHADSLDGRGGDASRRRARRSLS